MKHLLEIETSSGPGGDREEELAGIREDLAECVKMVRLGPDRWIEVTVVSVREMHELGY